MPEPAETSITDGVARNPVRRALRILKWASAGVSLLIILLWVIGSQRFIRYTTRNQQSYALIQCCFCYRKDVPWRPVTPGWLWSPSDAILNSPWHVRLGLVRPQHPLLGDALFKIPLWVLLAFLATPVAVLFWLDRRRIPPGHCRACAYNLTGNVSGVCSECGRRLELPISVTG